MKEQVLPSSVRDETKTPVGDSLDCAFCHLVHSLMWVINRAQTLHLTRGGLRDLTTVEAASKLRSVHTPSVTPSRSDSVFSCDTETQTCSLRCLRSLRLAAALAFFAASLCFFANVFADLAIVLLLMASTIRSEFSSPHRPWETLHCAIPWATV